MRASWGHKHTILETHILERFLCYNEEIKATITIVSSFWIVKLLTVFMHLSSELSHLYYGSISNFLNQMSSLRTIIRGKA